VPMVTVIELKNGTVLKVHESAAEVHARLQASPDPELVRFSGVSGALAVANPASVVSVREERF
jgi:hypothetical protein